jgi:molybdopterin/thiamine biosynthesis adenylyltransferase
MNTEIIMTNLDYRRLVDLSQISIESGAVVLVDVVELSHHTKLLVREIIDVPDDAYDRREWNGLSIKSDGYMHALKRAAQTGTTALWLHTHPGENSNTRPSRHDHKVNDEIADLFGIRSGTDRYGYLVIGHNGDQLTFTGEYERSPIERLTATGDRLIVRRSQNAKAPQIPDQFSRHIKAFGPEMQGLISDLNVTIVGAGGTGSSVAEQLVRLGVRKLTLIDDDILSESNVTRVYGSTPADVGIPKVDVLADHLHRIAPDLSVTRVIGTIVEEATAKALLGADIVFGCTDDNAGRLRLSRLPYYYLIPVIDCGVKLDADAESGLRGIFGRVTVIHPGNACLVCRDRIDLQLAEAEVRSHAEQEALAKEGYAPALPGIEPAVVPFTTAVAAAAVNELLERLIGYGETPTPSELLLRVHDRIISTPADQTPAPGHYCDPARQITITDMFLGMNWAS